MVPSSVMEKIVTPSIDVTESSPRWASTIDFVMASPSPAPPRSARRACQKRSKIRGKSSVAIPAPVSGDAPNVRAAQNPADVGPQDAVLLAEG